MILKTNQHYYISSKTKCKKILFTIFPSLYGHLCSRYQIPKIRTESFTIQCLKEALHHRTNANLRYMHLKPGQ